MLLHPLTNFEIPKYYENAPRFNGAHSRNNLTKLKDEAYVINLDEYNKSVGTYWVALYVNGENVTYFGSFGVKNFPKETKTFIENKNITTNISRTQAYNSIICRYFCIGYIDFVLKSKSLLDYTNLFYSNEYEKNDKIILKYFQ